MNGSKESKWFHPSSCFCSLRWIYCDCGFPGKVFPLKQTWHTLSLRRALLSRGGHEPASPWRLRLDKAVDSARSSGRLLVRIRTLLQSQGDSRWLRIPLESNLSKAVEEGQHRWSHGGPAWRKKGIKFRVTCRITKSRTYCVINLFICYYQGQRGREGQLCVLRLFHNLHLRSQCDSMVYSFLHWCPNPIHTHTRCFMHSCSVIELPRCKY